MQWYQNDIACIWDSSPVISYAKSGNTNIDAMQKGNDKKPADFGGKRLVPFDNESTKYWWEYKFTEEHNIQSHSINLQNQV